MKYSAVIASTLLAVASAKDVEIKVAEKGLTFTPQTVKADKGDRLVFTFVNGGHDVVVGSTKVDACTNDEKATNYFYSGMIGSSDAKKTFVVDVTTTDPIWFFCSVASHCSSGMFGAVNLPSDKKVSDYDTSGKTSAKISGNAVGGQVVAKASDATSSSSGASSSGASTTTGSMTSSTSGAAAASSSSASTALKAEFGLFALVGGIVAALL